MIHRSLSLGLGLGLVAMVSGAQGPAPNLALDLYDLSEEGGVRTSLPRSLAEISGLATSPDGRLFAHNDEQGIVYELDPEEGEIIKAFFVGLRGLRADFEGMAVAGERFFLITSGGDIVEFREGRQDTSMGYEVYDSGLGGRCETEGLAYDPAEEALLLPCKTARVPELKDHLVVFSLSLETMELYQVPRVFISHEELETLDLDDKFHASAIEVHPETGSLLLVAAREETLVEVSAAGRLLAGRELKRKNHPQPEGIAILSGGDLVLADEGQGKRGRLTRYSRAPGEEGNDP
jgi:uncharacterized protein YjiK